MKTLQTIFFAAILFSITSCNSSKKTSDTETETQKETPEQTALKGFMVGGMYFINGYGGVTETEKMVETNGTSKEDLVKSYTEIFTLPFTSEQATGIKSTLKEYWNIDSKEKLVSNLEDLKIKNDPKNPHKAWDYARIVNNACMGYGAGYLTADEAKKVVAENLVLAQKDFKNWKDFLVDYNAGRKTWDPESKDVKEFDAVTTGMTQNANGIYQLLPLNQ